MKRGRPETTIKSLEIHIHLRLHVDEDDDLISFLRGIPPRRRVSAIKSALRAGGMQSNSAGIDQDEDDLATAMDEFLK